MNEHRAITSDVKLGKKVRVARHWKPTGILEGIRHRRIGRPYRHVRASASQVSSSLMEAGAFKSYLLFERRRTERSRRPFALMLLDVRSAPSNGLAQTSLDQITGAITSCMREIDVIGWYECGAILAVIFTGIDPKNANSTLETLRRRTARALEEQLGPVCQQAIAISLRMFPCPFNSDHSGPLVDWELYPELEERTHPNRAALKIKRAIDIVGSVFLLLALSPLFAIIALAIKFFSDGPVLFKQERLGQFGARFQVLKFRTMYVNNDAKIHREYAERLISGKDECDKKAGNKAVYKLTKDPRVTTVGRWLRKTSLDELPQFWNVLRGEMSLVGPRPPLLYEFENYDLWHRRRVLEVKPGITGLWQVSGRCTVKVEDMVRLDLKYYRSWSLWLDLKILLWTPFVVFFGEGAY